MIRSRYVVGADGARSTVRTALGINFTGTKPEMTWAVLDTFIDTDFHVCSEIVTFQLNQESRVAWIPRERDLARFYVLPREKSPRRGRRSRSGHTWRHTGSTLSGPSGSVRLKVSTRIDPTFRVDVKEKQASEI